MALLQKFTQGSLQEIFYVILPKFLQGNHQKLFQGFGLKINHGFFFGNSFREFLRGSCGNSFRNFRRAPLRYTVTNLFRTFFKNSSMQIAMVFFPETPSGITQEIFPGILENFQKFLYLNSKRKVIRNFWSDGWINLWESLKKTLKILRRTPYRNFRQRFQRNF